MSTLPQIAPPRFYSRVGRRIFRLPSPRMLVLSLGLDVAVGVLSFAVTGHLFL